MIEIGKKFKKEPIKPVNCEFGLYRSKKNSIDGRVKAGDIVAGFQWEDSGFIKQAIVFPSGRVSLFWTYVEHSEFEYLGPVTEIN